MTDWLTDISMFFCTEGPAITVSGWTDYFDFEGEDDTYSLLKIDDGAADIEEARRYLPTYGRCCRSVAAGLKSCQPGIVKKLRICRVNDRRVDPEVC